MYTNLDQHGGNFKEILSHEFLKAKNVSIASGYVGLDVVKKFEQNFLTIADNGGVSKLLLGMAFYEGLSQKKLNALNSLNMELKKFNYSSGVYVTHGRRYHGKVYHFYDDVKSNIYLGSSNFSSSGIKGNIECTLPIYDTEQKQSLICFLNDLYSAYSISIDRADITVPNKKKVIHSTVENQWDRIRKFDPKSIDTSALSKFEFPLSRIAEKEKSNLNVYFGKGRLNSTTGKITPRPWYEIELIASNDLNSQDFYPHGDFDAYTDDGFIIPMKTQGDYDKNIRSRGSLQIFGIWLKGKLERKGVLMKYQPVTLDILEEYGSDKLIFFKIKDGQYYMKF